MAHPAGKALGKRGFDELWEELLHVREGCVGEIVDGEIVETQRPGHPHVGATSDLGILLGGWFRFGIGGPGGWVILDEPRVRFGDMMRVPDLAGWRTDRFVAPRTGPYLVMPDWICEALSPSTAQADRTDKLPLYARHGVRHLWLLDAVVQTLEVFRLENERWVLIATYGAGAKVRVEPFDAVELDHTMVWGPPREPEPEP